MWNAITTTAFEQRGWNNQTGLELTHYIISAIFLILSLHFSPSHVCWSRAGLPLWKGSFCSCHCPVIWILTPSLSHWWLNLLMQSACLKNQWGVLWASSPNQSSTPTHHAVSSSTNRKKHCSAHKSTVPPSKVTFRLRMDEKRGNIWEGLMSLTWKLSIMIWLFHHKY